MKLHCFLINNQLVVSQELSQLAQVHFIRGEKSTSTIDWNLNDWQHFKEYLQGSLGLESLNDINIQLIYSRTKKDPVVHFKNTFKHAKTTQNKDVDAFQYFDPLTLQATIKNKASDIVTWLNQMLVPEKTFVEDKIKRVKKKTQQKVKTQQDKIGTLSISPFYEKIILDELKVKTLSKRNKPIEGLVTGVTGSGFYIFVEGYKVFITKISIKQSLPPNRDISDYSPADGDIIELKINDNKLLVLLNEKVKDNV